MKSLDFIEKKSKLTLSAVKILGNVTAELFKEFIVPRLVPLLDNTNLRLNALSIVLVLIPNGWFIYYGLKR